MSKFATVMDNNDNILENIFPLQSSVIHGTSVRAGSICSSSFKVGTKIHSSLRNCIKSIQIMHYKMKTFVIGVIFSPGKFRLFD